MEVRELYALLVKEREPSPINKEVPLRRFQRAYRLAIINDYLVHFLDYEFDINKDIDPKNFEEAISRPNSLEWIKAVKEEIVLMH